MSGLFHNVDAVTLPDGRIEAQTCTNDNDDDGYDDGDVTVWTLTYQDRASFDRCVGKSRIGCTGIRVKVVLDGLRLT